MSFPLILLIPAYNEAAILGETVAALRPHLVAGDRLIVIDDGSTDDTARVAAQAGASVACRPADEAEKGKGAALGWWARAFVEEWQAAAGIVVIDADARLDSGFMPRVRAALAGGAEAVQGFIQPVGPHTASGAAACFTTLLEQRLDDAWRARLSWPVRLRGTGMAFHSRLFAELVGSLHTQVEDVELSLRLTRRGIPTHYLPEAVAYDPLPANGLAAARQRARWLQGQGQVWRAYWPDILALIWHGPWAWSLLSALLLKPRSLIILLKVSLNLLFLVLTPFWSGFGWLAALLITSLLLDAAYLVAGLWVVAGPGWQAALAILLTWVGSLWLALTSPTRWLRARFD